MQARERVRRGDPRLASSADLLCARRCLAAYRSTDAEQLVTRARMLAFVDAHPSAHLRSCAPGHLTASALLVDASGTRLLLTLHRKLQRWLQLGGHCDGETNLALAALKEAEEESGIEGLTLELEPIDLDVHSIPARPGEPEHLHLDTRFLVYAPLGALERSSAESSALAWFRPEQLAAIGADASLLRLARRLGGPTATTGG